MILAAGFGTRLFPLTIDRTKPAIPFLGKPLVGYVAEYVAKFGFTEVVVNLHHQPESVMEALGEERLSAIAAGDLRVGVIFTLINGCVNYSNRFFGEVKRHHQRLFGMIQKQRIERRLKKRIARFQSELASETDLRI